MHDPSNCVYALMLTHVRARRLARELSYARACEPVPSLNELIQERMIAVEFSSSPSSSSKSASGSSSKSRATSQSTSPNVGGHTIDEEDSQQQTSQQQQRRSSRRPAAAVRSMLMDVAGMTAREEAELQAALKISGWCVFRLGQQRFSREFMNIYSLFVTLSDLI